MNDKTDSLSDAFLQGRTIPDLHPEGETVHFRDDLIARALSEIENGRSLLLVGEPGVGKTAIIRALDAELRKKHDRHLRCYSSNQVLSGTMYIGEWQSKLDQINKDALSTQTILFFHDIWNLPHAGTGTSVLSGFWDQLRPEVTRAGGLQIVGEIDDETFEKTQTNRNFVKAFSTLEVPPLTDAQYREIIKNYAEDRSLNLSDVALGRLTILCDTFWTQTKGLRPKLEIVDALENALEPDTSTSVAHQVSESDVEGVFAKKTGLPEFIVSPTKGMASNDVRRWFRERIIGQEQAVEAVIEAIALFKAGMHNPAKPIGTFMFVGPSGVGKTELAKALALYLFGSEDRLLRFDLSEFAHFNSFEMLIGSPEDPKKPARLLDPVRTNPFQVILFDEIEKGHFNVQDIMLQLLDEGRVSPVKGPAVSFRNTIVIATSNAGAAAASKATPGFGGTAEAVFDTDKAARELEVYFRPEFLNRFQHIVHFRPLTKDQALRVAEIELKKILRREGIVNRNIAVDIDPDVLRYAVSIGYDARYGGRALQRTVQKKIVLPIALTLMERAPAPGSILHVFMRDNEIAVAVVETEEAKRARESTEPVRAPQGFALTREQVPEKLKSCAALIADLSRAADEGRMRRIIEDIDKEREDHTFWQDAKRAAARLAYQSRYTDYVSRIDRLRDDHHLLEKAASSLSGRSDLERWAFDYDRLTRRHERSHRQLVSLGEEMDWPALLEIAPINATKDDMTFLFQIYADWCKWHDFKLDVLCEPVTPEDPTLLLMSGPFAYGYLKLESGHHRVRHKEDSTSVLRLRVAPWEEVSEKPNPAMASSTPKSTGLFGGKIRSRVELPSEHIVLQNDRSIFENSDLLGSVVHSLMGAGAVKTQVVRRYDLNPFFVRDADVDRDSGSRKAIGPELFHDLLCARIDHNAARDVDRVK